MGTKNDKDQLFETASATTDPDNANSGSKAYIIVAVCLGVMLLLGLLTAGCVSMVIATAVSESSMGGNPLTSSPLTQDDSSPLPFSNDMSDLDELENLLKQYEQELGTGSNSSTSSEATTTDALDFDLAPYGTSIDKSVSASSYAGTPTEVRDFVRGLVSKDADYTKQVTDLMDAAALNEEARSENLGKAEAVCDEAAKALGDMALPTVKKDKDGKVVDLLGSAKQEALERWQNIKEEITILKTSGDVDTRKLWRVDDDIVDATSDAADLLTDAMTQAAKL